MSNYLEKICDNKDNYEFNFVFKETGRTNTVSVNLLTAHPIKPDIQTIRMWYDPRSPLLMGLQFFDFDGNCIYESAWKDPFTV